MTVLRFLYQPVDDLELAIGFYRDMLGLEEAWRDGARSVGLALPGGPTQVMLSTSGKPAGPMYLVDDLDAWRSAHPNALVAVDRDAAGTGAVMGFRDPGGNVFYVFDQAGD